MPVWAFPLSGVGSWFASPPTLEPLAGDGAPEHECEFAQCVHAFPPAAFSASHLSSVFSPHTVVLGPSLNPFGALPFAIHLHQVAGLIGYRPRFFLVVVKSAIRNTFCAMLTLPAILLMRVGHGVSPNLSASFPVALWGVFEDVEAICSRGDIAQ